MRAGPERSPHGPTHVNLQRQLREGPLPSPQALRELEVGGSMTQAEGGTWNPGSQMLPGAQRLPGI